MYSNFSNLIFQPLHYLGGAKRDRGFRISDLVKNSDGTDIILISVVKFGEVRRVQLAKSTLLTSTLVPLGSFKISSDDKERMGCGKQREATASIQSLVKLQPWFLSLRWKACLWQICSLGSCAFSEGSVLGQNPPMMMMMTLFDKYGHSLKMCV